MLTDEQCWKFSCMPGNYNDMIRAIYSAGKRQALDEMGWQPIETAPKDGTPILAWNVDYGQRETRMGKYGKGSPGYADWERGEGSLNSGWDWVEPQSAWLGGWSPTHWMPLPSSPKEVQS